MQDREARELRRRVARLKRERPGCRFSSALCVPARRAPPAPEDPRVVRHVRSIDAATLLATLGAGR